MRIIIDSVIGGAIVPMHRHSRRVYFHGGPRRFEVVEGKDLKHA
jgi:hypothetical protein